jgi:hypothetical protein
LAQIQKGQVLIVPEGEGVYLEEGKSVNSLEKSMSSVFSKISDIDTVPQLNVKFFTLRSRILKKINR